MSSQSINVIFNVSGNANEVLGSINRQMGTTILRGDLVGKRKAKNYATLIAKV